MAKEEVVTGLMNQLVYATKHDIGDLMAHKGIWKAGTSAVNNSYKILMEGVQAGKLEKISDFFRLKGKGGNHEKHSRLITAELIKIIKLNFNTQIFREVFIGEKSLIPDAMILLVDGNKAAVFILEVMHNETEDYFRQKVHTWEAWQEANGYLSNLFGVKVKAFQLINKAEEVTTWKD